MSEQQVKPLWTDERIIAEAEALAASYVTVPDDLRRIMRYEMIGLLRSAVNYEKKARAATMSDKPHIPLSELRDMWQRAEDDAAPWGEGRKGTSLYFRHAVEEEIKRINEAERIKELEAELAQLRAQLADMTNEARQMDSDWLAMMRAIAEAENDTDTQWNLADDATLLEEFDPWQALRKIRAQLAECEQWEDVGHYGYTEHLNMGADKPSKWQRVEVYERMITIDRNDTGMHSALLPLGFRIQRRKESEANDG